MTLKSTTMFYTMVGAAFLTSSVPVAAPAADLYNKAPMASAAPMLGAVDGVNGKAEGFAGSAANRTLYGAKGALSIPLQGQYGAQIDGAIGSLDSRTFGSIGGHLFWRDPGQGLIGLYVNHTWWDQFGGAYVNQVAAEVELYRGRWTLQGIAGVEGGNSASETSTSVIPPIPPLNLPAIPGSTSTFTQTFDVRTRFFDQINLKYYFTDNWDGYVGHRYLGGRNALALGTEYALPLQGGKMAAAFVEGRVGEGDFHGVWGGLKIYFGQHDKPLIARHRQDDPNIWGVDSLFSIMNSLVKSGTSTVTCPPTSTHIDNNGLC
jgi:hypothetical protein